MRSKISLAVSIFAIFLICAGAALPANAAPAEDACALLTQAQVSAALGIPVGAGTYVTPTYVKTCTFSVSGDSAKSVSAVTISYQSADGYAAAKGFMEQAKARTTVENNKDAGKFQNDTASGIGDDAFYTSMGTGYTGLLLKKGNVSLKIAIYGNLPAEKKKDVEKTLALQALAKI
ncbi:MAG: hypothetical protein LAO08_06605 [Acidobacteriia bacterium]|nr:hypothetical protein [Terriglobia bacterium]